MISAVSARCRRTSTPSRRPCSRTSPAASSVYAREGWRKYFSLAGPIAVFGYWFAWSSVLAVYGGLIGSLIVGEFFTDRAAASNTNDFGSWSFDWAIDVTSARLIATGLILACYVFNIPGMRPAVWFSYVTGAMMVIPVVVLALGPFITGDFSNHAVDFRHHLRHARRLRLRAEDFNEFALIMVWLYVIGWSTYGPEAPATFAPEFMDTKNDTRKADRVGGPQRRSCRRCCRSPSSAHRLRRDRSAISPASSS